jgi:AraC-like DNA-binding protein
MQYKYPVSGGDTLPLRPVAPLLCGANAFYSKADFGEIFFDHIPGDGFEIWFGRYRISQPATFYIIPEEGTIEFWCHYENKFLVYGEYSGELSGRYKQYQISRLQQPPRFAEFPDAGEAACFTLRFKPTIFEPYAKHCPTLDRFLKQTEPLPKCRITDKTCYLTPQMDAIIREILQYQMTAGLANHFYQVKVHEFLMHLSHHLNELDVSSTPSLKLVRHAEAVHALILSDFSIYDTVEKLASKLRINEQNLQTAFRYRYGMTVGRYSRERRLQEAFKIITGTDDILLSVALQVGYSDLANFCSAFKKFFGYPPGNLRKRKAESHRSHEKGPQGSLQARLASRTN